MANKDYWQNRFVLLEESQLNKGIEYYHELEKQYTKAANEIEKDITTWYSRFAVNNGMTMAEARKILTNNELKELKWSVEEYIQHGRENNIDGRWMKELENASARVHISRLEAIKLQMQQHCEVLFGNEVDSFDRVMRNIYTEGYYRTAFELQKGVGVGYDLMKLDKNKIDKVISKPWAGDGSNFSSRIWKQRSQMVSELHNQLTQMIIRGQTPDVAVKAIKDRFKVSQGQAGRLVMTETAFFHSAAQKDSFNALGVEKYEICAVLDGKTSETCRNLDGEVIDMKDFQPGVTAPPFHQWCRTTTVPYFDDEFTEGEVRAATDEDGKTYYVPANMKYHEWKETFVDGGSKKGLKVIKAPTIASAIISEAYEEFSHVLVNSNGTDNMVNQMLMYSETTDYVENTLIDVPFAYDVNNDNIAFNPKAPNFDLYDLNIMQAHELAHRMDVREYHSWKKPEFKDAVDICANKVYNNQNKIISWFDRKNGEYRTDIALSDIISALTKGQFNNYLYASHDVSYWLDKPERVYQEIFANIASIDVNGSSSKKELQGIFEELFEAYEDMVK